MENDLYVPQDLVDAMQTYDLHLPLPLLHEDIEGSRAVPPSMPPLIMPISGKRLPGIQPNQHVPEPKHLTPPTEQPANAYHVMPPEGDFCPLVDKYEGRFKFRASVSPNSKKVPTFSKELNTFFIQSQVNFAVEFDMDESSLPSNLSIRTLVCYSDPTHVNQPITPCSCNAHISNRRPEYGDRFIISTSRDAEYTEKGGHKMVTIKLSDMQRMGGKFTAVYSYASYTSCLAKNTKVSTVFSLMDNRMEVGRDVFYCCVCACPPRDMAKALKKNAALNAEGPSRRRKRRNTSTTQSSPLPSTSAATPMSSVATPMSSAATWMSSALPFETFPQSPSPDPDMVFYPDEEGYYTFKWRMRDRETFSHLCAIKRSCMRLQKISHSYMGERNSY